MIDGRSITRGRNGGFNPFSTCSPPSLSPFSFPTPPRLFARSRPLFFLRSFLFFALSATREPVHMNQWKVPAKLLFHKKVNSKSKKSTKNRFTPSSSMKQSTKLVSFYHFHCYQAEYAKKLPFLFKEGGYFSLSPTYLIMLILPAFFVFSLFLKEGVNRKCLPFSR